MSTVGKLQLTHLVQMLEFLIEMVTKLLQVMLVAMGMEVVLRVEEVE